MEEVKASAQTPEIEKVSFQLYEPSEKKNWVTPNVIVYGSWFLTIGFFWLFDGDSSNAALNSMRTYAVFCVGGISLYYLAASFFTYKPLNGNLDGEIDFTQNGITINGKLFMLKDIVNLDFFFINYYGEKPTGGVRGNFDPWFSQGVSNWISFTDNAGNDYKFYFQLKFKEHYQDLAPFINVAIKANKITFKRAIDLVGIENVSIN